jgi:hypothetical protein
MRISIPRFPSDKLFFGMKDKGNEDVHFYRVVFPHSLALLALRIPVTELKTDLDSHRLTHLFF